jgi:hypothetical protein
MAISCLVDDFVIYLIIEGREKHATTYLVIHSH